MKYRQSGMPNEDLWDTFFDPIDILTRLGVNNSVETLVDIGCGYGTFLLPASKLVKGKVVGIDIDLSMIEICKNKAEKQGIKNIDLLRGDISTEQTIIDLMPYKGLVNYITLFNILHCEKPIDLLNSVYGVLKDSGKIGVIHWKSEDTPRGPSMEIRPTPEMIIGWASDCGLIFDKHIDLPPYHFGLVFHKKGS